MTSVLAYLDPGSGSMILQILAGGVAAVGVAAKMYWRRVSRFLHRMTPVPGCPRIETAGFDPTFRPTCDVAFKPA